MQARSGEPTGAPDGITGWDWRTPPAASEPARRRWLRQAAWGLGLGSAVAALCLGLGFLAFVHSLDHIERAPLGRADGIVVLTGGSERVGDAIDLLARGYGQRLLISGVNERTSRDEIGRLNPGQKRLLECCVDLDYRARNTIGNAIETRRWMRDHGFRSVIVVTSNYHMPRTLIELDHALPDVQKVPYAVVPENVMRETWWRHPGTARLLASEYAKFLICWARTRLERDPERSTAAIIMGRGRPVLAAVPGPR